MMKTTFTTLSLLLLAFFGYAQNGPITFEPGEEGADWTWTVFENDTNPDLEIIPNPDVSGANTSATVAKFTALETGAPFAGCESQQVVDLGTFEWDSTNRTVKIMVWKSVISDVGIKFDSETGWSEGEIKVANTVVNEWEELTFDFSGAQNPPASEGDLSRIVIFPDFDLDGRDQDNVAYFDNIRFEEGGGGGPADEPTAAAPDPEEEESDVLSLFSGVYTDVDVDTWRTPWSQGDLEDIEIEGNATKKYTNLDFVGVETTGDNLVDASGMEFFHVDLWTPNMETVRIKLVDFGPNGEFQGGDDSEHELIFTDLTQGEWNSLKLPLEDFEGLENTDNLAQYIFSGLPAGTGTLYVDNVYFSTSGGGEPDEEVVGVETSANFVGFANVFETPANGGAFVFGSPWAVPDLKTVIDPAENAVTLFPNFNTYAENPDDPFWVDQMTGLGNKIFEGNTFVEDSTLLGKTVTFEGEVESFTLDADYEVKVYIKVFNADFSEVKEVSQPLTEAGTFSITFDNPEPEDAVVQYGFSVTGLNANPDDEAALGNVVLVGEGGGDPGDEPTVAAPDPTEDEANVLSMFSGVYTDVDVDTWRTPWSQGDLEDIEIQGNPTKKYTNIDFVGIETTDDNLIDASDMDFFHIDLWTPNMDTIRIKLVDWGPDGQFDGGDDTEHELIFTDLPQGEWNSLQLPLEDFEGLAARSNLAQYILSGLPTGAGTLYVDNVCFIMMTTSVVSPEAIDATVYPNPTSEFVILETNSPATSFTMYTMNGQRVLEKVNPGNKVNVSELGAGLYITEIKTKEGVMRQRLIIQ